MEAQIPLIIFTTLVAWSAGVFGAQAVLALKGEGKQIQLPALIISVALLAVSGIAVFFHLQHWERIFNGFGHLSSGITQELIAIVAFAIVAVVYFAFLRKSEDGGTVPSWLAILAIIVSTALAFVCAHSYVMAARPAWDTILWPLVEIGEAAAFGMLTVQGLVAYKHGDAEPGALPCAVAAVFNGIVTIALVIVWQTVGASFADVGYYFDPTQPTQALADASATTNVLFGEMAMFVWMGILLIGAIVPAVYCMMAWKIGKNRIAWITAGFGGAACVFVGCLCLRAVFYTIGLSVFMFY